MWGKWYQEKPKTTGWMISAIVWSRRAHLAGAVLFTLGQGQLPSISEPCFMSPQMFWLQQQYAVYQGRSTPLDAFCALAPRLGRGTLPPIFSSRTAPAVEEHTAWLGIWSSPAAIQRGWVWLITNNTFMNNDDIGGLIYIFRPFWMNLHRPSSRLLWIVNHHLDIRKNATKLKWKLARRDWRTIRW